MPRRRLRKRLRSRDKLRSVLENLKDKGWLGKLPLLREELKRLQDAKEKPKENPSYSLKRELRKSRNASLSKKLTHTSINLP